MRALSYGYHDMPYALYFVHKGINPLDGKRFFLYTMCIDSHEEANEMAYNEQTKKKNMEYIKAKQQRIPVNWLKSDYEERVRPAIEKAELPVSTFIKQAVNEKIDRDGLEERQILPKLSETLRNMDQKEQQKILDAINIIKA